MNNFHFIIKSLTYFKKQHIGVFLATLLSTAVLTGALIVGDSVVYSLQKLVDKRLGKIESVLITGDRFISDNLADKIASDLEINTSSVLLLEAISINPENQKRVTNVQVLGIDSSYWKISDINMPEPVRNQVVISSNLANKLNVTIGDELLLRVRNAEIIPLNSPFTDNDEQSIAFRVEVIQFADDNHLGRFSLRNNQKSPYNIFINREFISRKVELSNKANLVLTDSKIGIVELNKSLKNNFTIDDAGIILTHIDSLDYMDLTSSRIFIDRPIIDKVEELGITHHKILTYFTNEFITATGETPYSFISAVDDDTMEFELSDSDIIINSWLADDLKAKIGDTIFIKYYVIGPLRKLKEESHLFIVENIIPILSKGKNRSLMPDFPGLADAESCGDWDVGIPVDLKKIRDKDELYWDMYKGTPKAYVSLNKGVELWGNKFGNYTTIRFESNEIPFDELSQKLTASIDPVGIGLSFVNVRSAGNSAASSGVDFGELFLSLSFFIIISALLLTVLIYSLNLNSRMIESGILSSLGFTKKHILKLRLLESFIIIIIASILGGLCGIIYNKLILIALNSVWNDAIHADQIVLKIIPTTVVIGTLIGIITSLTTIYYTTKRMLRKSSLSLVKQLPKVTKESNSKRNWFFSIVCLASSLSIVIYSLSNSSEIDASAILAAAFLFLTGCVLLVNILLKQKTSKSSLAIGNVFQLAIKNSGRNRGRSIAVISLLAIGTFTIIITGSNRLTFNGLEKIRQSGTGGFNLWVENTIPIMEDLNTEKGQSFYGIDDVTLDNVEFVQFHNLPGDDASCLNLNQVQKPQILGINPILFDSLNAFSFAKTYTETSNPWLELNKGYGNNIIPVIADQTVIQWGLIKSIGDTLNYINEYGDSLKLVLVGGLNPSIFQGNLLISDRYFIQNFPSSAGSKIMMVEAPDKYLSDVTKVLEKNLLDNGIEISSTSQRLRDFYSVTNTYLTIFMILGSLGVLLGTIGLGIVIIRNLHDRKQEINLYSALGFSKSLIFKVITVENLFLLFTGIALGVLSAIIGIIPSLASPSFNIPGNYITVILTIVTINGLFWIYIPTLFFLKNINPHDLGYD